jgi:hypothetical protein
MNTGEYQINWKQIGPVNFQVFVESWENVCFSSILNCHPQQLTQENIMNNFNNKEIFKNHWFVDVESEIVEEKIV